MFVCEVHNSPPSWTDLHWILLRRIYQEREELNGKVTALLASASDEGAQQQLSAMLAQLKGNLSSEMRAWSEQHFLLFRMLLSPTQVKRCKPAVLCCAV